MILIRPDCSSHCPSPPVTLFAASDDRMLSSLSVDLPDSTNVITSSNPDQNALTIHDSLRFLRRTQPKKIIAYLTAARSI